MQKGKEDSSFSLNKERPPLKRPKTLTIPTSSSTTNSRFDRGVSIENGSPASNNGDFPNEQWKYPSFLGTTRRKRTTVKPNKIQKHEFANSMGARVGGDQSKAGTSSVIAAPLANSSSASSFSSWNLSTSTTPVVTLPAHSSTRRPQQNNHSPILYLVSSLSALGISFFFYLLFFPILVKRKE